MDIELLNWLKDGPYRKRILGLLTSNESMIPSEIAKELKIHRASVSRILSDMKKKKLINSIKKQSRTISYTLNEKGSKLYQKYLSNKN